MTEKDEDRIRMCVSLKTVRSHSHDIVLSRGDFSPFPGFLSFLFFPRRAFRTITMVIDNPEGRMSENKSEMCFLSVC